MALQVWLPLNGDLKNKGCADVTVTNNGATVNNNGKIGKCYDVTKTQYLEINNLPFSKLTNCSISLWLKVNSIGGSGWLPFAGSSTAYYILATSKGTGNFYHSTSNVGSNAKVYKDGVQTLVPGSIEEWHHYVITGLNLSTWTKFYINHYGSGWNFAGSINDIRIYDHCLSPKEVKEISKGLVLHYKLDENFTGGINLIKDGWGGTNNWSTNTMNTVSTDVPENTPYKNSYCQNISKEYIPLISDHSYTISMYGKKDSSCTAPNWLVTLIPYDADKLQIQPYMIADYFRFSTKTTLASELKNGDTVVHLTDASTWTTSSGAYIAVFGYTNSLGYTYPDMVYTRKVRTFNTSSIDTTNNTITLSAAWNLDTIPAGTTVCRSTAGNGYWYPTSKSTSSMTVDTWYFLSKTFTPNSVNYIKPAKYVRVRSTMYAGNWVSGLTLIDNTLSNSIHDTSGYNNNGTINGTLTLSTDSPRYEVSTGFNGTTYIQSESPSTEVRSISLWVKWNSIPAGQSVVFIDQKSKIGFGLTSNGILCSSAGVTSTYYQKSLLSANTWYHFVIVNPDTSPTSTTRDLYINGVKQSLYSGTSNWTYSLDALQLGKRSTTSDGFDGQIADFRIYATALSADDIRQLYEVSAWVDESGNLHSYEFDELNVGRELLAGENFVYYSNGTFWNNFSSEGLEFQYGNSLKSNYIEINPDGNKYLYDFTVSVATGNQFYIGFERYDENKTSRSNNACVYAVSIKPSSDIVKRRYKGVINLATDGVNPCKYIRLRVLNGWTGTDSSSTKLATIHNLSLREVPTSTTAKSKLYKTGIFESDLLLEGNTKVEIEKNIDTNSNWFIET